jgi:hypothetical protein
MLKNTEIIMTRTLCLLLTLALVGLTSGCLFSRKNSKPKENQAIAAELEESFRQRWIEKRTAELTARGLAADLARPQAIEEFKAKFNFPEPKTK